MSCEFVRIAGQERPAGQFAIYRGEQDAIYVFVQSPDHGVNRRQDLLVRNRREREAHSAPSVGYVTPTLQKLVPFAGLDRRWGGQPGHLK
jgi:hypothetical protein